MLCQQAGVQEAGREHSRGSSPKLSKGIFHTIERHAQYINRGELARRGGLLLGHRSAGGEQLHCASLVFSWVLFLFFLLYSFSLLVVIVAVVYFITIIVSIIFYLSY